MSKHYSFEDAFPGYDVTSDGVVWSITRNWRGYGARLMKITLNADGYPSVRILVSGKRTRIAVHRLVAAKYLPYRPSPCHEIRHLNGNKLDNCQANLCWGTRAENASDRELHGRTSRGKRHSEAILLGLSRLQMEISK